MPYHLYVPTTYNASRVFPLVIALHGLGASEDSMFSRSMVACKLAEQHALSWLRAGLSAGWRYGRFACRAE